MNKRIHMLFLVCVLGLLLPTAVSHTLRAASQPAQVELVSDVEIEGPRTAVAGLVYTYTAVTPLTTTTPVTYVWQAAGQTITHINGVSDTLAVTWPVAGLQPITVTADDGGGIATAVQIVNVIPPARHSADGTDVYAAFRSGRAIVAGLSASVFGPHICTAYGDPFPRLTVLMNRGCIPTTIASKFPPATLMTSCVWNCLTPTPSMQTPAAHSPLPAPRPRKMPVCPQRVPALARLLTIVKTHAR